MYCWTATGGRFNWLKPRKAEGVPRWAAVEYNNDTRPSPASADLGIASAGLNFACLQPYEANDIACWVRGRCSAVCIERWMDAHAGSAAAACTPALRFKVAASVPSAGEQLVGAAGQWAGWRLGGQACRGAALDRSDSGSRLAASTATLLWFQLDLDYSGSSCGWSR